MSDFPTDRDGWTAVGRTQARWNAANLGMPFSQSHRPGGDGEVTALRKGEFLETRQEDEGQDFKYAMISRESWADGWILATHKLATRWETFDGVGEARALWAPLFKVNTLLNNDPMLFNHRFGLYAFGDGRVFTLRHSGVSQVVDKWGHSPVGASQDAKTHMRSLNILMAHIVGKIEDGNASTLQTIGSISASSFSHTWIRGNDSDDDSAYANSCYGYQYFQESEPDGTGVTLGARVLYYGGNPVPYEMPNDVYVVEGARYGAKHWGAVGYDTLDDGGAHVVKVRVFSSDGADMIERTIAGSSNDSHSVIGLWRAGPGTLVAAVSHYYPWHYGMGDGPFATSRRAGKTFAAHDDLSDGEYVFLMVTTDNGNVWRRLPENRLLAQCNKWARRAFSEAARSDGRYIRLPTNPDYVGPVNSARPKMRAVPWPWQKDRLLLMVDRPVRQDVLYKDDADNLTMATVREVVVGVLDTNTGFVSDSRRLACTDEAFMPTYTPQEKASVALDQCMASLFVGDDGVYVELPSMELDYYSKWSRSKARLVRIDKNFGVVPAGETAGAWYYGSIPHALDSQGVFNVQLQEVGPMQLSVKYGANWPVAAEGFSYQFAEAAPANQRTMGTEDAYNDRGWYGSFASTPIKQAEPYRIVSLRGNPTPVTPWVSDDRIFGP